MMPDTPVKPTKAALRRLGPGEEESFLSRWSQRKEAVRAGEELVEPEDVNLPIEVTEKVEEDEAEEIDLDALPDIETMDASSDFSLFMKKGIPDELRNKALRKLWLTDPVLANVDGLVDYGEDFTGDGLAGKAFKTAWKVGQGFLTDDEVAALRVDPEDSELQSEDEENEIESDLVEDEHPEADEATETSSTDNDEDVTGQG